jgi:hypothetical protein
MKRCWNVIQVRPLPGAPDDRVERRDGESDDFPPLSVSEQSAWSPERRGTDLQKKRRALQSQKIETFEKGTEGH